MRWSGQAIAAALTARGDEVDEVVGQSLVLLGDAATPLAEVLRKLGSRHVMVVHSRDGLDEISIGDKTEVAELKNGAVRRFAIQPEDYGVSRSSLDAIKAADPEDSVKTIIGVLDNTPGPARDIVVLNAGAALATAEPTTSIPGSARASATASSSARAGALSRDSDFMSGCRTKARVTRAPCSCMIYSSPSCRLIGCAGMIVEIACL